MEKPNTKKEEIVDMFDGIAVADPYRWLEQGDGAAVRAWSEEQNEYTFSVLKDKKMFPVFSEELVKNFKVVNFSNPVPVRGRYFYTERQPDEDQAVLYMKKGLEGSPVVLYDPNNKKEGNTTSIDYWEPSPTGTLIAYGVSQKGDEMATLYVKNTDSNQELPDVIERCRYSSVRWLPDESGFYYTRNPRAGAVPENEAHLHPKAYLHLLGNDPNEDELIFGEGRPKDDMIGLSLSPDGRHVGINASQSWTQNEIYVYDRLSKETTPLVVGVPAKFSIIFLSDKILLKTNHKANNYKVLHTSYNSIYAPLAEWGEFIPEAKFPIQSLRITRDKVLVEYLVDVCSKVSVFDYGGIDTGEIPLPPFSSLAGMSCRRDEEEFFYGVDSFLFPKIVYRFDPSALRYKEYRKTDNPINPERYEVTQEWYQSKDGTRVPLFLFYMKGIQKSGSNPTILYGYGGFNSSVTPMFMRGWAPWIQRGGIFAVANIRGGGEFGSEWHKAALKENKQNSYDDFIAGAEYLIAQGYTNAKRLGIVGGSNGGLLVSAVAVQRPDLFGAVSARVPLTDMVRFPRFGIAMRWVHEYGDPQVPQDLRHILKWSPYHNVRDTVEYPNFLFVTGDKDTRVDPLHARKMAAFLQAANKANEILIFTETNAGHGPGKPIAKVVENQALSLTFFAQKLGLAV